MKKIILLFALCAAVVSGILLIPTGVESSYKSVKAFRATAANSVTAVDCSGTLEAEVRQQVVLGCQVKISKNYFKIGDHVKKGQKLLAIDRDVTLQSLDSAVSQTEQTTSSTPAVTQSEQEDASNALKQAIASGIIGQSTYNELIGQLGATAESSAPAAAQPTQSDTSADAEKLLDQMQSELCAPISGTVTDIADGTGGLIPAGTVLAEISDFGTMQVKAQVNEDVVKDIKVGQLAEITGSGFSGTYEGTVKQIYPEAESETTPSGTNSDVVTVVIGIDNPTSELMPGLSADVSIKISEQRGVVTVPYEAVNEDDDGTEYVYVFSNGRAVRRNILTGNEDDSGIEVLKGLKRGDIVIDDGSDTALDGENVRIN